MTWTHVGVLILASCACAQAAVNTPAADGKCSDPDPATAGEEDYACPIGFARRDATGVGAWNADAACTNEAECKTNCCVAVEAPSGSGTCGDPNPATGHPDTANFQCPVGMSAKSGVDSEACTTVAECEANCCTAPAPVTVTVTMLTTTTETPWDSSSGVSGNSLAFDSMTSLDSDDSFGSQKSSGIYMSGSGGFNMPIWAWILAACLLCCCCAALVQCCKKSSKKKATRNVEAKKKVPAPAPEPIIEEEPLLPPLLPVVQPSYVPTTAVPAYGQVPMTTAVPTYGQVPMTTAMPAMQPITTGYGGAMPGVGYPGAVV